MKTLKQILMEGTSLDKVNSLTTSTLDELKKFAKKNNAPFKSSKQSAQYELRFEVHKGLTLSLSGWHGKGDFGRSKTIDALFTDANGKLTKVLEFDAIAAEDTKWDNDSIAKYTSFLSELSTKFKSFF